VHYNHLEAKVIPSGREPRPRVMMISQAISRFNHDASTLVDSSWVVGLGVVGIEGFPRPLSFESMATVPPDTSYPQAHPDEFPQVLFNDPDADLILRSGDSQTFRVLKLYLIRSSTVLGQLIRAASNTSCAANLASAGTRLPEVQLSDSGTILSCLLTFIFPIPSILPSSLDEKMELLSVAQKYKMSSVIDHIRGSLSLQDPPFIHIENALLAYSLAQRYGLRHEAIQAARLTLKFRVTLTIEDNMPGAYLHELWKHHQRVRAQLRLTLPSCGAGVALNTFKCSLYGTGPPNWVHSYINSITENPAFFDPTELQVVLIRHYTSTTNDFGKTVGGCSLCTNIPAETMRTFWTTLAATIHRSMEKVSIIYVICTPNVFRRFHRSNQSCRY
jgi:hypothetical protein